MPPRLLATIDRLNREHPWSHNDAYGRVVVHAARRVRRAGGTMGLDVGCGTGVLVRRLAHDMVEVTGVESDAGTAALAATNTEALPNVEIVNALFPLGDGRRFDLVSLVAVLHHLPLIAGLRAVKGTVAPGGRVVIVGLYRETDADRPLSILSLALNPLVGLIRHPQRAGAIPEQLTAPTTEATETFPQIRDAIRTELPGAVVHRGPFWRYVATWTAPTP